MATTIERPTEPKQIMWSGLFNDTCEHSLPILQNIMSNALLKVYSKLNRTISIATHPVPQKNGPKFNPLLFSWTMSIAILLPYMSSLISVDVVEDRENKVKNQLRVSGLNFHAYWAGVLVSHSTVFLFSLTIMVILLICLKVPFFDSSSLTATCILLVLHVPSSLLCCYVLSHMFNKHETAKAILPSICALPSFIIILPVIILDMMGDSSLASILHYVFCVLSPFYAPAGGLYFITKVSMVSAIGTGTEDSVFSWKNNLPGTYLIMALQIILYYILLRVVEVLKSGGEISDAIFLKSKSSSFQQCSVPDPEEEDEDVKAERRRINANCSLSNQSIVMLDQVRKVYSPLLKCRKHVDKVAVKNISLGIDSGNIFGLLGPNGAGKTTTARMITAEEAPTCGQVYVAGMKVKSSLSSAFTEMGYCPQEDALWKLLTVEEHLHLFAAIKGVPKSRIDSLCKELIDWLHIGEHAKKKAKTISGGTKRKMCFIMSILGMPKAVLLDEPSTGLDPQAKRHLWNLICSMFPPNGQHSVILTTHSMEEADALCTRVGIMVKGVMRCLGSTQHLKNKYGIGYALDLKVGRNDSGSTFANEVKAYIKDKFPAAEVKEEFEDRITFSVPQSVTSLANVFSCLEEAKSLYNIEEYSFSQTTLEQVFLGFAKEQEENDTTVTF